MKVSLVQISHGIPRRRFVPFDDPILMMIYNIGLVCRGNSLDNVLAEKFPVEYQHVTNPTIPEIKDYIHKKANKFFDQWVVGKEHTSLMEHVSFTFFVDGISRACSHQLVRHRMASYTQESQRYTVLDGNTKPVLPNVGNPEQHKKFVKMFKNMKKIYAELIEEGYPKEDARGVLPNCTPTKLFVTMNGRSLLHFFRLRLWDSAAQWEIREVARRMHEIVSNLTSIFEEDRWNK